MLHGARSLSFPLPSRAPWLLRAALSLAAGSAVRAPRRVLLPLRPYVARLSRACARTPPFVRACFACMCSAVAARPGGISVRVRVYISVHGRSFSCAVRLRVVSPRPLLSHPRPRFMFAASPWLPPSCSPGYSSACVCMEGALSPQQFWCRGCHYGGPVEQLLLSRWRLLGCVCVCVYARVS